MAIRPDVTAVVFSGTYSGTIYADSVTAETLTILFERDEFKNSRLRTAPTSTGALPIIQTAFGGQPVQISTTCTSDSPRPLAPDNATNLIAQRQMQRIARYTLSGGPSLGSVVDGLETLSLAHLERLSQFDYQQNSGNSAELSYTDLIAQQSNTYAFLTTSGLSVTGNAIGSLSNAIIRSFKSDVYSEFNNIGSGNSVYKTIQIVLDVITIESQSV